MTKSRIFLLLLLSFIGGVGTRSFAAPPYTLMLVFSSASGMFLALGISRKEKAIIVAGFCLIFFTFGIFRMEQKHMVTNARIFGGTEFRGVIYEDPERKNTTQEIAVAVFAVNGKAVAPRVHALVTMRKYPAYHLGDELVFSGSLKKPENFNEFDYVSFLRGKNITAVSIFPRAEKIGEGKAMLPRIFLSRIKYAFEGKIDLLFVEPYAALLKGLLLGERALLPQSFLDALKTTGTTHIVALSGYNITLVGMLLLSFLLRLTVPFRAAFWTASVCIVLFVLLTGASASVVRAGIMGMLALVAQNEGRAYHMTNALAFAAALMIFHNPFILRFDTGFQLSFLATCGIIYLPACIEPRVTRAKIFFSNIFGKKRNVFMRDSDEKTFLRRFDAVFIETLSAQIFVLPLLIYAFGSISLVSIIANLAVLLAVPYAMGWGFAAVVIVFLLPSSAGLAGVLPRIILAYIVYCIEWFAKLPYAAVAIYFFPWYAMVSGYLLIIFWIARTRAMRRHGENLYQ